MTSAGTSSRALQAPERGARHPPSGDQEPGDDVEGLSLAGHPTDGAQSPPHPGGFDGLAHHLHVARGLEGVVGPEPVGHLEDRLDGVLAAVEQVGGALAAGELQPLRGQVHADDPLGPLEPRPGDGTEADHPGAEHGAGGARPYGGGLHCRPETGREAAGEQAGSVEGRLAVDLGEGDLRHHGVLRERRGAHEVAHRLAVAGEAGGAVGEVAEVLLLADREAEVRQRADAVDALSALGREEGDDVVSLGQERHVRPAPLDDARALVSEDGGGVSRRVNAGGGVHVGVAHTAGHQADQHLFRTGLGELHVADHQRAPELLEDGRPDLHRAARAASDSSPASVWLVADAISTKASSPGAARPAKLTTLL